MQQVDYRIRRHQNVFLLEPQNEEAVYNLEDYKFCYDRYGEGACMSMPFNKNGSMIIQPEYLAEWIDHFKNNWVVCDD